MGRKILSQPPNVTHERQRKNRLEFDSITIDNLIESEPFDILFSQTPELNQLFLCHPITGDGWGEDGRIPDLLDFC